MTALKISYPSNEESLVVGVVEHDCAFVLGAPDDMIAPAWCSVCADRFDDGDAYLLLADGGLKTNIGIVCQRCIGLKNENEFKTVAAKALERVDRESKQVAQLRKALARVAVEGVTPHSLLTMAIVARQCGRDSSQADARNSMVPV